MSTALMSMGPSAEVARQAVGARVQAAVGGAHGDDRLQQDLVAYRRGQADAQPRGLRAHGREVVELARDVDGEARDRRRVGRRVGHRRADLRGGRARLGRELRLGAQRRGRHRADLAGRQVDDEALEIARGLVEREVQREVRVGAGLGAGGRGGDAGGREGQRHQRARGAERGDERRAENQSVEHGRQCARSGPRRRRRRGRIVRACCLSEGMHRKDSTGVDEGLAELARRQWGVVSLAQLRALGLGPRAVQLRAPRRGGCGASTAASTRSVAPRSLARAAISRRSWPAAPAPS